LARLFKKYIAVALFSCMALVLRENAVVRAEERELPGQRSAIDAVLLLDASGSMNLTDPLNLRYQGAKLLLQFLGASDRLAVVAFSERARVVRDLKPYSKDSEQAISREIEDIKAEGRFTDLLDAVKVAKQVLDLDPREEAQRVIILLSDGKMEPDPAIGLPMARTQELVNDILPELKATETKVHTLALSEQADRELLGEIANSTDGLNWFSQSAADIHKSFADLFLAVKRPQVVAMTTRGFKLDEDVEEATFYVNRQEGNVVKLVSPRNEELTAESHPEWATWFSGQGFDVITMKEPEPGQWEVQGVIANEGFATVLTNLKLTTDWPSIIRADDRVLVQVRLYESEKPIAIPEMSGVIKYAFQVSPTDKVSEPIIRDVLNDEGKNGDRIARDGIFSGTVSFADPGEYRLTVIARGPTFQRTQQLPFRVRPRLVSLEIVAPQEEDTHTIEDSPTPGSAEEGDDGEENDQDSEALKKKIPVVKGDPRYIFRVELSKEVSSFRMIDVKLMAKSGDKRRYELPLKRSLSNQLQYEFIAGALPQDGQYLLQAFLNAETKKKGEVEATSKKVIFERGSEVHKSDMAVRVVLEDEKKEEPKGFPIVQLGIVTAVNMLVMFVGMKITNPSRAKGLSAGTKWTPARQILEAVAALEEKAAAVDIDLTNPLFSDLGESLAEGEPVAVEDATAAGDVGGAEAASAETAAVPPEASES
jgi:Mg-chelatase subunit ChlD